MYSDIYYNIASFLHPIDAYKALYCIETSSTCVVKDKSVVEAKELSVFPLKERFNKACEKDYVSYCKYHLSLYDNTDWFYGFNLACARDSIEVVKWIRSIKLMSTGSIFCAFREACQNNSIKVVKFMHSLNVDEIGQNLDSAFYQSCKYNCTNNAKYIYSVKPDIDIQMGLNIARQHGSSDVIDFLFSVDPRTTKLSMLCMLL